MKVEELSRKLQELKIDPNRYSLYGDLKLDAIILYPNYAKWEVFHMDERARRSDERVFFSEDEACEHVYAYFLKVKDLADRYGFNI
ncbi:hypothetical protein ACWKWU_15920 [Chitinophaga lutea]